MYILLDHSEGRYSVYETTEEKPKDWDENLRWIAIDAPIAEAWEAHLKQDAVFQALFRAKLNIRYREDPRK